jgi:nucleotide-binding universal stress UspA family protein
MKTQLLEAERVVDLVPQILHLKKILVPIDFSDASKKALKYAFRFAEQFNCEIVLLHVVEPVSPTVGPPLVLEAFLDAEDSLSIAEKKLAALSAQSRTLSTNSASSTIRTGHAPNEITKAAKDLDIDLIIIATHGYTSWRHLCIGSTAERVVRSAPCPVLVVREKEHEFV